MVKKTLHTFANSHLRQATSITVEAVYINEMLTGNIKLHAYDGLTAI